MSRSPALATDRPVSLSLKSGRQGVALGHGILYATFMAAQGMYRKRNAWASDQHSVRVKYDGGAELEVPEKFYAAEGWQPPIDALPWDSETGSDAKGPLKAEAADAKPI